MKIRMIETQNDKYHNKFMNNDENSTDHVYYILSVHVCV